MPRIVDPEIVRRWAELAVNGMTVAEIRKAHKDQTGKTVDPRTIERALKKTAAEISERTATAAELQRGIQVHGEQLIAGLDPLIKSVKSTVSSQINPLPIYAIGSNHVAVGSSFADRTGDSWTVQVGGGDSVVLRLLKEHLPEDRAWKALVAFTESTANWVAARIEFASAIQLELDGIPLKSGISSTSGESFELSGLSAIEQAAVDARLDGRQVIGELLDTLVVDPTIGGVRLDLTKLSAFEVFDIGDFRKLISEGITTVMKSSVGRDVLTSRTAFDRTTANLVDELTMLKMVTYLPGTCKSCRRFRQG